MKVPTSLRFAGAALLCAVGPVARAADASTEPYAYGSDPKRDAEFDISSGLAGLGRAVEDPKLLVQLMKDLMGDKDFKQNVKGVQEKMADPDQRAQMEAKMEHMLKTGQKELQTGAKDEMAQAMRAMGDPDTMAQAARMMKDPKFQEQLAKMAKDPSFQKYTAAMQDMMKDPATKGQMEQMANAFKSQL